jgi:hypothetical protein
VPSEEVTSQSHDLLDVGFQGEVACIQEVIFQRLYVPLVRLSPGGRENLVVSNPRRSASAADACGSMTATPGTAAGCCLRFRPSSS